MDKLKEMLLAVKPSKKVALGALTAAGFLGLAISPEAAHLTGEWLQAIGQALIEYSGLPA